MNDVKNRLDEQKLKLDEARQIFREETDAYNKLLKEYKLSLGIGCVKQSKMTRTNPELYKFMTHLLDCSCGFCADMRKELGLPSINPIKDAQNPFKTVEAVDTVTIPAL